MAVIYTYIDEIGTRRYLNSTIVCLCHNNLGILSPDECELWTIMNVHGLWTSDVRY